MIDDWYSYGEIRFTQPQIEWGIKNLVLLKVDQWPACPEGNAERTGHSALRTEANFVKPAIIAGEIEARLEMVGRDGDLCMLCYHSGIEEYKIARMMNWDVQEVGRRIDRAMSYMSGWHRRKISYREFINHRREKHRTSKLTAIPTARITDPLTS